MPSGIDPEFILSLPPSTLATIPGANAPPGQQAFSPNPETLRPQVIVVGSVFLVIATIFIATRFYVKLTIVRKIALDDYVCALGFLFSVVQFAGIMTACTQGAGGRHMWDSSVLELLSPANAIANWLTTVFVTPALGTAKATFFIQYYHLFWPFRWVRMACWIGGGLSMAFYLAVTITMFVLCSPWPGENFSSSLLSSHYGRANDLSIPTGVVGAAVDIFLLILPVRAVMSLKLPAEKKVGLVLVFMTGALASIASIVGLAYRVKNSANFSDPEWGVALVWIWMQVELFSGIACSCMPSLSKLISSRTGWALSSFTPRRIFSYLHRSENSKLYDESKSSGSSKPSTSAVISSNGTNRSEKRNSFGDESELQGITLVREVDVYDEQAQQGDFEHGGVDRRWR